MPLDNVRYWTCEIGPVLKEKIPDAGDMPLRKAVQSAFLGMFPDIEPSCSSGWGPRQANLGLASTDDMLNELRARFEVSNLRGASVYLQGVRDALREDDLKYRTVD